MEVGWNDSMARFLVRTHDVMSVWAWVSMYPYVFLVALIFCYLIDTGSLMWPVDFQSLPVRIQLVCVLDLERLRSNQVARKLRKSKVPGTTTFPIGKLLQDAFYFRAVPVGSCVYPAGTRRNFKGSRSFPVRNGRWNLDLGSNPTGSNWKRFQKSVFKLGLNKTFTYTASLLFLSCLL